MGWCGLEIETSAWQAAPQAQRRDPDDG